MCVVMPQPFHIAVWLFVALHIESMNTKEKEVPAACSASPTKRQMSSDGVACGTEDEESGMMEKPLAGGQSDKP